MGAAPNVRFRGSEPRLAIHSIFDLPCEAATSAMESTGTKYNNRLGRRAARLLYEYLWPLSDGLLRSCGHPKAVVFIVTLIRGHCPIDCLSAGPTQLHTDATLCLE